MVLYRGLCDFTVSRLNGVKQIILQQNELNTKTLGTCSSVGAEEKHSIVCDFGDKLPYGKIKTSISVWGIVGGY